MIVPQLKKNIARWVLRGISVLGILFGFFCLLNGIVTPLSLPREDFALLCLVLGFSAVLLVLGAWLIRDSYLMLRRKAFGAIQSITALLALAVFGSVVEPLDSFAATLVSGIEAESLVSLAAGLVALLSSVLVYSICNKLLKRVLEVAYSPEETPGTQRSTDKQ